MFWKGLGRAAFDDLSLPLVGPLRVLPGDLRAFV